MQAIKIIGIDRIDRHTQRGMCAYSCANCMSVSQMRKSMRGFTTADKAQLLYYGTNSHNTENAM